MLNIRLNGKNFEFPEVKIGNNPSHGSARVFLQKVKVLVPIDEEKLGSVTEFVAYAVTENRLLQGVDYLKEQGLEVDAKNTGPFLKWLFSDVMKEERDALVNSNLAVKDVSGPIQTVARKWWLTYIETA